MSSNSTASRAVTIAGSPHWSGVKPRSGGGPSTAMTGSKSGLTSARTHAEKATVPPGASRRAISATWACGSTNTTPMLDTTASNAPPGSPVSEASAVTQVTDPPPSLAAAIAIRSGVMSTPVTRAPRAAAANAALPVPHARSTTAAPGSGRRRPTASTTSSAMWAMRRPTVS